MGPQWAPELASPAWGNVPAEWRAKIKTWGDASQIPYLWAFLAVVMNREAGFVANVQNMSAKETGASASAVAAGIKRGNPAPKYAEACGAFGSGGLFGALAPYFCWIGFDEGYMPFLNRKPTFMFTPDASAVFALHYAWRILSNYSVRHWMDVRTGWASPSVLKKDRDGATAGAVRTRMFEDMTKLNLLWLQNAPATAGNYPGINKIAPMFGFNTGQAD